MSIDNARSDTVVGVADLKIGNGEPITIIAGVNVLEDLETALTVGEVFRETCDGLGIPYIFKASYDKANRSSADSFRGPGLDDGLALLQRVKQTLGVPILTDVHTPEQCAVVSEVADVLQIPAFLVRQTDLVRAAAATSRPLHLKKMQIMAPEDMYSVARKCIQFGAKGIMLCERGTAFGYHRLVVDIVGLAELRDYGLPTTLDVTHSLQLPGSLGNASGGRGHFSEQLAMAGAALGLAAIFIESYPNPAEARCDGPSAVPLERVPKLLRRIKEMDEYVKSQD
jgi:2-dehydro-3-deoxyphosphooctonate aldolase (KDO 8-P synthase)